jgi:probable RNA-binding protein EIF1AD
MSATTKKKHVCREVLDEFVLPSEGQTIVKVVAGRGNNLHEVIDDCGNAFLVSMPTKFRKNVWIKRGDFVIVDPIEEGDKVKAEIATILYRDQIRYIKRENQWPSGFEDAKNKSPTPCGDAEDDVDDSGIPVDMLPPEDDEEDDDDEFLVSNPNRPPPAYESCEDSDADSDEDSEEEEVEDGTSNSAEIASAMRRCQLASTQSKCKG